ncbi:MAG: hypothetical protein H5U29_10675 [Pusillimonas sp.]|nr:hypothetical protein [Pusillimonas sp.]
MGANTMTLSSAFQGQETHHSRYLALIHSSSEAFGERKESAPPWSGHLTQRLNELMKLEEGWDGYQAKAISFLNVVFAQNLINSVCTASSPEPQVVPGFNEDLQIEWYLNNGDIELWVQGPNNVLAWYENHLLQKEQELELSTDFSEVSLWLKELRCM